MFPSIFSWLFGSGSGGAASNSFTTMQPISGTSPVAVTSADTLNFTSGDSSLTIAGTAGTDTLDFRAVAKGTVTSVGFTVSTGIFSAFGSPITAAGVVGLTLTTQSANLVLAGPASGGAVVPAFRGITYSDLPTILGFTNGPGGFTGNIGITNWNSGTNASSSTYARGDGTWAAPAGSGTVTSVGVTSPPEFNVTGSPVTTSGYMTLARGPVSATPITGATYVVKNTDFNLRFDATSNAISVIMPDPTLNVGHEYYLSRVDNTGLPNQISIFGFSLEMFGMTGVSGFSTIHLNTPGESWKLASDAVNWPILEHKTTMPFQKVTSVTLMASTTAPIKGPSITIDNFYWWRIGNMMMGRYEYVQKALVGGVGGSMGLGTYGIPIPKNNTIDSNLIQVTTLTGRSQCGSGHCPGTSEQFLSAWAYNATMIAMYLTSQGTPAGSSAFGLSGAVGYLFDFAVPITNWEP